MAKIQDIRNDTPKRRAKRPESAIRYIARHHSATPSGDFWSFWNGRWRDLGWITGGYHEIILRDGTVQVCYPPTMKTNGIGGHNANTYHICLVGNGDFTDAQERAWQERVKYAMSRFNVPVSHVLGHNEFSGTSTACPGINMNTVRSAINSGKPISGTKSESTLLRKGDSGASVKALQRDLIEAGESLPNYGADGHFGDETVHAVKSFQRKHGLAVDGIAGTKTLGKLGDVLAEKSETNGGGSVSENQTVHESHEDNWHWAEDHGFLNGERPKDYVTREQLATVMKRFYDEIKEEK